MSNQQLNNIANFPLLILQFAWIPSLARLEGFEPPAYGLEVRSSIHLSYRRLAYNFMTFLNFGQGKL